MSGRTCAASIWVLVFGFGCVSHEPRDQSGGDRSAEVDELPVQFSQGLAIIEVEIEGLERPARLVIDSGAITVIDSSLAPQLAYSVDHSVASPLVKDASERRVDASLVLLRRLRVGRQTLRDVPAALVASDAFALICPPIDGVLGTGGISRVPGFLDRVAVEIDRDSQRVRISEDGASLGTNADIRLPLRRYLVSTNGEKVDDGKTWIPVVIKGELRWAALDTGLSGLSTMTSDMFQELFGRSVDDTGVREYLGSYGVHAADRVKEGAGSRRYRTYSWAASASERCRSKSCRSARMESR